MDQDLRIAAAELITWIEGAGSKYKEMMFANAAISENADIKVDLYFLGALLAKLDYPNAQAYVYDLYSLLKDSKLSSAENEKFHDVPTFTLGEVAAMIALQTYEDIAGPHANHENVGIRIGAAALTQNPTILRHMSNDPCMLVRTTVAVNDFKDDETRLKLRRDPYFHVQRRTLYGNPVELEDFDLRHDSLNSLSSDSNLSELWPSDCTCN